MFFQVLGTSWLLVVPPAVGKPYCNYLNSVVVQFDRLPERFVTKSGICWIRFVKGSALGVSITTDHHYAKLAFLGGLVLPAWVDQSDACWPFVRWSGHALRHQLLVWPNHLKPCPTATVCSSEPTFWALHGG